MLPEYDRTVVLFCVCLFAPLQFHCCASYASCCGEGRRGTVCTLAGSGRADPIDSSNASAAAIDTPIGVTLYPPKSILVTGLYEHRVRIIHGNGSVGTLAGG